MSKKKHKHKHWVAVVCIYNPYTEKSHFSVLSFQADNRFYAIRKLEEELPLNPQLIDENDKLLPYHLLEFHQIKDEESEEAIIFYQNALADLIKAQTGYEVDPLITFRPGVDPTKMN